MYDYDADRLAVDTGRFTQPPNQLAVDHTVSGVKPARDIIRIEIQGDYTIKGLDAIDYTLGPVFSQRPRTTGKPDNETLLICDDFRLERWTCKTQFLWYGNEHCHLWTVLEGSATAIFTAGRRTTPFYESGRENDPDAIEELERGDSILVPAMTRSIRWIAENNEPIVLLVALLP